MKFQTARRRVRFSEFLSYKNNLTHPVSHRDSRQTSDLLLVRGVAATPRTNKGKLADYSWKGNFLRLNSYSKVRWHVPLDPTKHYFDSRFEIKTTAHKQAEWRNKLAAAR